MHTNLGRRNFVTRLCAAGVAGGLGMWRPEVWALEGGDRPRVLAGSEFDLAIARSSVEIGGRSRRATTVNGTLPGPVLRWREGDTVTLRVANRMDEASSIHWHGIVLPSNMDGVPGLSFDGIAPGSSYTYRFKVRQHGTYWYHSHSSLQEQTGVYGPLIIDPAQPDARRCERDYVVMLSDWSDEDPRRIKSRLKKQSNYYNFHQRTLVDLFRDARRDGWRATLADRRMWSAMRMSPTDLSDVGGYTYTYLVNGAAPDDNWTGLFNPGERVRLRFINASAMSYFDVRIPGLRMTVVAADGQDVEPVGVDEFRIAVAETYDVVVEPGSAEAYTIFAQSMDRSGYARATLARREGLAAPVPALDPRPLLTMADMGMDHGAMAGMSPDAMQGMDHGATAGMSSDAMQGMGHGAMAGMSPDAMLGMDHGAMAGMSSDAMQGMDHGAMAGMSPGAMQGMDHGAIAAMSSDAMQGMDHSAMAGMPQHPATERGNPLVDAQAMAPTARLDDPGVGLRDNGRRVLTYADLRSTFPDPDGRSPMRSIELHLTGHMEKFAWSFNGLKFSDAGPIRLRYGERVRLVLVNDTMMAHPIHLHGMWSDLEDEAGRFQVRKHTIDMPPGTRRSYRVTADALGRWAYHCHLLFHMETGMFREVVVEE
ncbi:copper resistance system multicopper oxidase [Burkholderia gladioli]|uniref:copper resistance system multicopper oxidase n=1 Tax=Burkholderia gladioli TaxID=28095 RepID=UPI00163EF3F8|nr:copper resistance system multicopper oxidase [Burkholderia gladioli]MBJ9712231.1 copper resistance system multicopper oxidase [Burkholderia gladioli]MBU9156124.1 copper resistance system multicopper oxidase [Burkholderia gladioli]MCH7273840.1 copper resistance system multicopper oxidase [Burkholderia gladioli]MDR8085928.1 copper resistance system multicopper oxidase [Burkholderia gladioli]MDZ4041253.1 copper resistance system multicopper oxidase [Burkholderia gladioli pv. alliicola]